MAAPGKYPQYLGDFHSHPRTRTWVGQLPSPDDLFRTSVAADYWELVPPLKGIESIERSPSLQVLLLAAFGLAFVIERTPGRAKFAGLAEQKADLTRREQEYRALHRVADRKLGAMSPDVSKEEVRDCLDGMLPEINGILDGRAVLRLIGVPEMTTERIIT
jgi:hypothetical protein